MLVRLAATAVLAVATAAAAAPPAPVPPLTVPVILGSGCFFARQHDLVVALEQREWGRPPHAVTSTAGYFGGRGNASRAACYYNPRNVDEYAAQGHAEAVRVLVPIGSRNNDTALRALWRAYFASFRLFPPGTPANASSAVWAREDYFDVGPGYRALLGFSGGVRNTVMMHSLAQENVHNMTFLPAPASGVENDTLGRNAVWVHDTDQFSFHQAELCLQFHDNQGGQYPPAYHALAQALERRGALAPTTCPPNYECGGNLSLAQKKR